jgi:small subunit ribosomal protein S18
MADQTNETASTPAATTGGGEGASTYTPRPAGGYNAGGPRGPRPAGGPGGPGGAPRPGGAPGGPGGRKFFRRKKVCKFTVEKIDKISYRDVRLLQGFVSERGKIIPRRLTGTSTHFQRKLTQAIKQARNIALLPFAARF